MEGDEEQNGSTKKIRLWSDASAPYEELRVLFQDCGIEVERVHSASTSVTAEFAGRLIVGFSAIRAIFSQPARYGLRTRR
jgi:hypothetical protein